MPSFSVIVISYNGKEFLRRCLGAIGKSSLKPLQIIVVDDYSNDGTKEAVSREFSFVDFIKNEKNLGPTASRNRGAKLAKGEYLIFLDNDVLVRPNTFEELVLFLENSKEAGVVGAKVIPEGKKKMWWNMGYKPSNFREAAGYLCGFLLRFFPGSQGLKRFSMRLILNYWDYNMAIEVGWVAEACFAIQREFFLKIGGFDERFFMYYEGPDLHLRVQKEGRKIYFYPKAVVDLLEGHIHSQIRRVLFLKQSKYLFYKKHYFYARSNPILFWIGRVVSGLLYLIA